MYISITKASSADTRERAPQTQESDSADTREREGGKRDGGERKEADGREQCFRRWGTMAGGKEVTGARVGVYGPQFKEPRAPGKRGGGGEPA